MVVVNVLLAAVLAAVLIHRSKASQRVARVPVRVEAERLKRRKE